MSVVVSIRVKKEVLSLVEDMVKYGLASSRNEAFNILLARGVEALREELERRRRVEELVRRFEEQGGIEFPFPTDAVKEVREMRD